MPSDPPQPDTFVSTQGAAQRCGVSRRTMLRWVSAGVIPGLRSAGGRWRIRARDLETYLAERTTGSDLRAIDRSAASGARIVVVDDDVVHAEAPEALLRVVAPQATVGVARDGFDAGLLFGVLRPHLVFLDIEMPELDGIEVARRARASETLEHMAIVVVSGRLTPEREEVLRGLGIDRIWQKPIEPPRIVALLDELGLRKTTGVISGERA